MTPASFPLALLPDFGGGEMMLILVVVLLLFGGDKMPQLAKALGRSIREFKKAANEVEREIKRAIDEVPDAPDLKSTWRQVLEDSPKPAVKPASVPVTASPLEPEALSSEAPALPPAATGTPPATSDGSSAPTSAAVPPASPPARTALLRWRAGCLATLPSRGSVESRRAPEPCP